VYARGDYRRMSERLRPAALELVAAADVAPASVVLDVAAGDGNVAHAAVARGARAVAVDLSAEQASLGFARARETNLDIAWTLGDASRLPVADGSCDAALSTFGAVYVPDPQRALAEMARVTRPGGAVGLTGWTDDGFQSVGGRVLHEYLPRDGDYDPYAAWGDDAVVHERAVAVLDDVEVHRLAIVVAFASVDDYWAEAQRIAPPIAALAERATPETFAEFGARFRETARRFASNTPSGISIAMDYLLVLGRARVG
ncbi:MAG: class I SAM-dependent methyltransferase, partial [Frankia sp.]|nr:class I SAM-dependent methyltransferase [Frankia sp.]